MAVSMVTDTQQPIGGAANSYMMMMSPQDSQHQWMPQQATDEHQQAAAMAVTTVAASHMNVITDNSAQMAVSGAANLSQLTPITNPQDVKQSAIFEMLRKANADGGMGDSIKLTSLPSLPSAIIEGSNIANASVQGNLDILLQDSQTVACEETVESMNEDIQMAPVTQQHQYTDIQQM